MYLCIHVFWIRMGDDCRWKIIYFMSVLSLFTCINTNIKKLLTKWIVCSCMLFSQWFCCDRTRKKCWWTSGVNRPGICCLDLQKKSIYLTGTICIFQTARLWMWSIFENLNLVIFSLTFWSSKKSDGRYFFFTGFLKDYKKLVKDTFKNCQMLVHEVSKC